MRFDFLFELTRVGQRVAVQLFFDGVENFARRFNAQIGGQQGRFEVLEQRRINFALAEKNVVDRFGKRGFGLGDRGFEALDERGFRFAKKRNHRDASATHGGT